ncbi:MAG: hypothetical protein IKD01_03420, partial [Oscillospiraceae bacterium]|nr:hypothetical protein [Oscillospiraceae bacterium]
IVRRMMAVRPIKVTPMPIRTTKVLETSMISFSPYLSVLQGKKHGEGIDDQRAGYYNRYNNGQTKIFHVFCFLSFSFLPWLLSLYAGDFQQTSVSQQSSRLIDTLLRSLSSELININFPLKRIRFIEEMHCIFPSLFVE